MVQARCATVPAMGTRVRTRGACVRAGKGQPLLEVCKGLLAQFGVRPEQYQIGRSKLFFRAGVLGQLEDAAVRINRCAWQTLRLTG